MALRPTDLPMLRAVAVPNAASLSGAGGGPDGRGAEHCSGPTIEGASAAASTPEEAPWQAARVIDIVAARASRRMDESTRLSVIIVSGMQEDNGESLMPFPGPALPLRRVSPT